MSTVDIGVLPNSIRFFHEADSFEENWLYSIPHAGIYCCNDQYVVERACLEACQAIMVDAGALTIEYRDGLSVASAGMVVLLDCREPHRYYASSPALNMRWFHFVGNSSIPYTQMLIEEKGYVIRPLQSRHTNACFERIMALLQRSKSDVHRISHLVHQLLSLLTHSAQERQVSEIEQAVFRSAAYIERHFADGGLSVEALAHSAALSPCYYTRKFKQLFQKTPHQYVIAMRIRHAKELLSTSSLSIDEISSQCGFSNASHFIMVFHKNTQLTPSRYRSMWQR